MRKLFDDARAFEFFQAVRLLTRGAEGRVPVATTSDPDEEAVRFRSEISLVFPETELGDLEAGEDGAPPELLVRFFGLATPACFGTLPRRYAEELLSVERGNDRNRAPRDFLDIFNHRAISLFFRAWEKYRFALRYERDDPANPFEAALFAAIGLDAPALRERLALEDRGLLARAGLLAMAPVPAVVLESLVESVFGVPAEASQFETAWYPIDESDQTRLGMANASLGDDAVAGSSVQLCQGP